MALLAPPELGGAGTAARPEAELSNDLNPSRRWSAASGQLQRYCPIPMAGPVARALLLAQWGE